MFSLIGLVVAWRLFDPFFWPLFGAAADLLYYGYGRA